MKNLNSLFYPFKKNNRLLYDYNCKSEYDEIINNIYDDVSLFDIYTFDGEFQNILINVINNFIFKEKTNYYNDFISNIYREFKNIVVPNIILIPLNNLKLPFDEQDSISLSENIKIFNSKSYERKGFIKFKKVRIKQDSLSKYYENNIFATLSKDHIILKKDAYFFNSPILTILIKNIPFKVEVSASKIAEASYSFIRMIDFDKEPEGNGWGLLNGYKPPSRAYGVYYNKPNTSPNPPYDAGYGHSFVFGFDAILDVNSSEFYKNINQYTDMLSNFIKFSFVDRRQLSAKELKKIDKWMNAVIIYNSAYEQASKERYDITIISLLTILESLFLNNTGNKKEQLAEAVNKFLIDTGFDYSSTKIKNMIIDMYNHRNKFVHEGKNYSIASYKSINDRQGTIAGMKPFYYGMFRLDSEKDTRNIYMLFRITAYVIMNNMKN